METIDESILFRGDSPWQFNACLNYGLNNWGVYCDGYNKAADVLVRALLRERATLDTVVYPLAFLYRQYLELRLKHLSRECSQLIGETYKLRTTHRLDLLWADSRRLLLAAEAKWSDHSSTIEFEVLDKGIAAFAAIDATSMAFRYPEDTESEPHNPQLTHVNVLALAKEMEALQEIL